MDYANKHIAILGCGSSGEAAAQLLLAAGAKVTVLDSAEREVLGARPERLESSGAYLVTGTAALGDQGSYDLAVLSPGIPRTAPLVQNILNRGIDMIGELELAYEMCACPVIAITGTNGKTTTTGLVASMLRGAGARAVAGGNMGPPFSALVSESRESDYAVIEVSSFQLEEIRTFHPKVAIWLNFAPDHLDRYANMAEYLSAKRRLFENQTAEDVAILNGAETYPPLVPRVVTFSATQAGCDFSLRQDTFITWHDEILVDLRDTNLRGIHNAENVMAALATGLALGYAPDQLAPGLCAYRPDAHRCEPVAEHDGVLFINDSKATNPSALEMALRSQSRPVVLIAGGKQKGFEFDSLREIISQRVKSAVLIGQVAEDMASAWHGAAPCQQAGSLQEAVELAAALAVSGDVVLLSPGTSSFDMFRSYEDRGAQFTQAVLNFLSKQPNSNQ